MIIGFTGTREAMSMQQARQFRDVMYALRTATAFHHGGARGADRQAWEFARQVLPVVVHPCPGVVRTSLEDGAEWREVFPPLVRNRNIANECDILIAAPLTDVEQVRSGTWATVRYARDLGKPVILLSRGRT